MTTTAETPYQLLPPLPDDIYEQLKADIAENGIRVPIDVDEDGQILDGHHRAWIAMDIGIECPQRVVAGLTETQKREHAVKVNALRRSLDREQRRELVAKLRSEGMSLPRIAKAVGVSVGTAHADVQAFSPESLPGRIVGSDGKTYAASRPTPPHVPAPGPDLLTGDDRCEPDDEQIPRQPSVFAPGAPVEAAAVAPNPFSVEPPLAEPRSLAETNRLLPPALIAEVRDADRRAVAAMRLTDHCEDLIRIANPEALAQDAPEDMARRIAAVRPAIEILTRFITTWENR